MTQHHPTLTLNNGIAMPALGLGVYQSAPEETVSTVASALRNGYRLIDTAAAYGNEQQVGEGIARSGMDREALFIVTKLWISDYGYDPALHAFDRSMRKLGLDTLDMYLLHWPMPTDFAATRNAWRAAERLLAEGRVRAIGVCNFSPAHLDALISEADIVPAVNQVELHPYFAQAAVQAADRERGVITQAWSPIGGVNRYAPQQGQPVRDPLQNPTVLAMAARHAKTPAQIVLRWHLDHGRSVIPKTVKDARLIENINVFDFSLTTRDLAELDQLESGARGGPDPELVDTRLFAFKIED